MPAAVAPAASTPFATCIDLLISYQLETHPDTEITGIYLGRIQRSLLNKEMRASNSKTFKAIRSPDADEQGKAMGSYRDIPIYVVDDRSIVEIVLKSDA